MLTCLPSSRSGSLTTVAPHSSTINSISAIVTHTGKDSVPTGYPLNQISLITIVIAITTHFKVHLIYI